MTESLNYILKKIEWEYLTSNSDSLKDGNLDCLKDVDLPCNCIPGVIVNFSAFLTMLFLGEDAYEAKLEINGSNGYIRCCKGTAKLFPIKEYETNAEPFVLQELICQKSKEEYAFIPFQPYAELQVIQEYLDKAAEIPSRYPADSVRLELSIRLLSAMRTRPLCQSSKVFLFMAAYLSPKRTLQLMFRAREEIGKEWLRHFILSYVKFLRDIVNDASFGFNQRLNAAFSKAAGFNIAAFLEDLVPAGKLYEEVLITSYRINLTDLSRKRTPIRRICEYISDPEVDKIMSSLLPKQ